ncbi:hypothetical protein OAX78_00630 [Planctomycetota bacterium]|nr:hypothetical protein [Planctomycetota bacterium]
MAKKRKRYRGKGQTARKRRVDKFMKDQRRRLGRDMSWEEDPGVRRVILKGSACRAVSAAVADLDKRLAEAPIRGWFPADLAGDHGLAWFGKVAAEFAAEVADERNVGIDIPAEAQGPVLEKLAALEVAADMLGLDWDDFAPAVSALSQAEAPPPPEEEEPEEGEEGEEGDPEASSDDPEASADDAEPSSGG